MTKSIKDILIKDLNARVNGSLWLEVGDGHFFGPGPVELLERIAETGSISNAAKEMKMSYKKAWELINRLNAQMATPVVIPQAGGEKGGGSIITSEAIELIKYHRLLRKRFADFLEKETKRLKF
ncbi:MAG: LysR family transcriptional regulator [Mucilaginibacter sp.]|nr:LysR family transcriptional regulator [Mucilaginibacter sp.]